MPSLPTTPAPTPAPSRRTHQPRRLPALAPLQITTKQLQFVEEYLIDLNATAAAKRAGYLGATAGTQLLQRPRVQQAIASYKHYRSQRVHATADRVIAELAAIAFADVRAVYDASGHLLPIRDLPDHVAATIASIEVVRRPTDDPDAPVEYVHKYKFWDKLRAVENLGKHFGDLIPNRLELTGQGGGPVRVEHETTDLNRLPTHVLRQVVEALEGESENGDGNGGGQRVIEGEVIEIASTETIDE
jgi:phage terminase small subunit